MLRNSQECPQLKGRKIYIPQMSYEGAAAFAAGFRSIGLDADISPFSDERTIDLGGRFTSGDECYPAKVTIGNFLKVIEDSGLPDDRIAFFMPTTEGPCRFGQYNPYLRKLLKDNGHGDIVVISPTSSNGYGGIGEGADILMRICWWSLIASDILRKLLLKTRPYEKIGGSADAAFTKALALIVGAIEITGEKPKDKYVHLKEAMIAARDLFRAVAQDRSTARPLIGVIGEIYCRLDNFTNFDLIRKVEQYGGECWIADISEWVWYSNLEEVDILTQLGKKYSLAMLGARMKYFFQHRDELGLYQPFAEDFSGYEEVRVKRIIEMAKPYLPKNGCNGEMLLNIGKSVYLHSIGADGIIDISPFTCMNGIVSEAIYPNVSSDHDGMPIRVFYFDGTCSDLDRDVEIFLELTKNYQQTKKVQRNFR